MVRILYPDARLVSNEMVIGWAMDSIANAKIAAGEFSDDEDGSKLAAFAAAQARPTLDEAKVILEDAGEVTFAR